MCWLWQTSSHCALPRRLREPSSPPPPPPVLGSLDTHIDGRTSSSSGTVDASLGQAASAATRDSKMFHPPCTC